MVRSMKKVINGLRYDTEIAEEIGADEGGGDCTDFGHWEETLYRTPRGKRYFLHGQGGPRSNYAQRTNGNMWGSGERIIPMTVDEAFAWAQEHLDGDECEATFADMIEEA
jgi:hypothetical protein